MASARPVVAHFEGHENHQNIFEDEEDYYRFLTALDAMAQAYEPDGTPTGSNYNLRYGHLFRERFKSEPVNDMDYFTVLLRYIHQNPMKAGIVQRVKDYEFCS